jgi:hypothetical protein
MSGPDAIVAVVVFAGAGSVLLTLAKGVARRIAGGAPDSRDVEGLREEIAQLRADVDALHGRVEPMDEIQNRLDFAERLLAQVKERGLLNPPKEH